MSMISEQIKHLRSLQEAMRLDKKLGRVKYDDSFLENRIKIIDDAIDTIKTLSAKIRANNFNNSWIKCEDRLPEIGQMVLCQCKNRHGEIFVGIYKDKDRYKDSPYFDWKQNGFPSVIAWQPLPEKFTEF